MGKSERLQGGNDHVRTPEKIWGPVVKHFGPIALDPFSNPKSKVPAQLKITNWTGKLPKGWTYGNGFEEAWNGWEGPVWLNGPYSELKPWMKQAHEDAEADPEQEIFLFVPVRPSGSAWQQYGFFTDGVCYLNFRVKHDYEDSTSPFHQAILYYGPRTELFFKVFESYGTVFTRLRGNVFQRHPIATGRSGEADEAAAE